METILQKWQITDEELTQIVNDNPSLRGFIFGYVSEYKIRSFFNHSEISNIKKYDDHDRTNKGDISFIYKGREFKIEAKSLQTNSVKKLEGHDCWKGTFQCDASDKRPILLPNGHEITTTCLAVGEFDIVAVSLFAFGNQWRFAFAKNSDLPHPEDRSRNIPRKDRQYLIKSSINITWPLQAPFTTDVYSLLDEFIVS